MKPDESQQAYRGKLLAVTVERWGEVEREIVEHPGSVAIVPVDVEGGVTLVRQVREAARTHLVELPAGTIDPGEDPLTTARRELEEETGLGGGEWTELASFWTTPGFCRERMTLFLAEGVEPVGPAAPDADEQIELVHWSQGELTERLGQVEDAKTLVGLLLYRQLRGA
jgi:ADP-ribose pyrophosphatase